MTATFNPIASAQRTVRIELSAVESLLHSIGKEFAQACQLILGGRGRVVVFGMGKSGHIGRKIAATLASTGTPSFFVHPAEASHGDIGMLTGEDIALAISNSGNTQEIITLLPVIKRLGTPLISITGNPQSQLAQAADVNFDARVSQEACPLNLAPTASTTVALVLGDALAIALLEARGFTAEDFAFSHPGGALGRRLLLKVSDVMHQGQELPQIGSNASVLDALTEISRKGLGMTLVMDATGALAGVFTDGDLRRALERGLDVRNTAILQVMTRYGKTVAANALAAEALRLMEQYKISALVVVNEAGRPVGVLHIHDLTRAGVY